MPSAVEKKREVPLSFFIILLGFVILMSVIVISLRAILIRDEEDAAVSKVSMLPLNEQEYPGPSGAPRPDFPESIFLAGEAIEKGNFSKAEDILRTLMLFYPDSLLTAKMLGKTFYLQRKYSLAEDVLRKLQKRVPGDPILLNDLSSMLAVQGKFREAIGNLHILLHADPDALPSRFLLAAIYAKAGNKNMALKNFRMVYDKIGKSAFSLPVPAEFKELTEYPEVRDLLPSQDDTEKRK